MIFINTWKRGLQFDVQRKRRPDGSFVGHLWCWDYRQPWLLFRQD